MPVSGGGAGDAQEYTIGDVSVTKYVEQILTSAISNHASDIHFEPYQQMYRVRFRIDGILYEIAHANLHYAEQIGARLKIIARLNIAEKRLPQDGRFTYNLAGHNNCDFRLSTCPTSFGEKMVVRILQQADANLDIDQLGLEVEQKKMFLNFIEKPQGLILVTGPTGSGKTITLYTALKLLNIPARNIATVEDPVEINLHGINQVEVNYKLGLNFVTAMRVFLRQDPDVIMVGEIRDSETAEIAVKAAQTGHLVISTLHTNSAAESIERLVGMGVTKYNLASSVSLVIAQRLLRKLCSKCKIVTKADAKNSLNDNFSFDQPTNTYEPRGCNYCQQGYLGRTGVFEMLAVSKKIRQLIVQGCSGEEIARQAQYEGMRLLHENALKKIVSGVTSFAEVKRVLG